MEGKSAEVLGLLLLLLVLLAVPTDVRRRCHERKRLNWDDHAKLLENEGEFSRCYKMSRASFEALATKLEPYLSVNEQQSRNRTGSEPITHVNKLHMFLRWLSGGSYHDIRSLSGVSVSAFYDCIHDVVDAIIAHPDLQLQFPTTIAAQRHAAKQFRRLSTCEVMKGCIGAVDGWLCPIRVPRKNEVTRVRSFFSGHYQRYGVNVQACCDHLSRFTAITCSSPGGTGDAVAFLKWKLSAVVEALPHGLYVVGDNAYTNTNAFLTPFPRPRISTPFHDSFNFYLSQLRIRIEMAFGLLVCKWRVFKAPLEISFKRVPRTILAACILHNWCINRRLQENNAYRVEEDDDLVDGIAELPVEPEQPPDTSVPPQDSSRYRQLYESSDLTGTTDTFNSSEWIRQAIVGFLERETMHRPPRNITRRIQETMEA